MESFRIAASASVDAPAGDVYGIIADYRNGHPLILPPRYVTHLEVLEGGVGDGTLIRFQMRVMGSKRTLRAEVTEPEPGRILQEKDLDSGAVTAFNVVPDTKGTGCRVTISTTLTNRGGLLGRLQRKMTTTFLLKVYREELELLARTAETGAGGAGVAGGPHLN